MRSSLAFAFALPFAALGTAQGPLHLDAVGGSTPGMLTLDLHPGPLFQGGLLLMGIDRGPTPISLVDPLDSRVVDVGLLQLELHFGLFGLDGRFPLAWVVPPLPSIYDVPLFFQGLSFGGMTTIFDQVSPPEAVWFAPTGACRDRGVFTTNERAFGRVLPRGDGRWMVAGGGRGALFAQVADNTTEIYDDVTDSFVFGPTMTAHRSLHTSTQLPDGRFLLVAGVNVINDPQTACEIYDPATDVFTACAPLAQARIGHSATLLPDGRVFVAGGLTIVTLVPTPIATLLSATDSTEIYDPVANTWTPGPNLLTPRAGHVAIVRPNGTVVLAGGISYDAGIPTVRTSTDVFTPAPLGMAVGATMVAPHALIDPVALGSNRWLVVGGLNTLGVAGADAEVYDAVANTWTSAGSMAQPRSNFATVALGAGRFLVIGGADGSLVTPTPLASGEVYDAGTNSWSPGPSLVVARTASAFALTPRGQIHFIGGASNGNTITRSSEWYYF